MGVCCCLCAQHCPACLPSAAARCSPDPPLRRGLEAVKRSQRVYLEAYTSLLLVPKEKLVGGWWVAMVAGAPQGAAQLQVCLPAGMHGHPTESHPRFRNCCIAPCRRSFTARR